MRRLLALAAFLLAFVSVRADEFIRAPIPKGSPTPTIEGKYTLYGTTTVGKAGNGGFGAADGGFGGRITTTRTSEVIITNNEIRIEARTASAAPTVMAYTLDASKSPLAIDAEIIPVRGKGSKRLGVVEINGSRVTIVLAKEGAERPKSVEAAEDVTIYTFHKILPPKIEFRIVALTVGKEAEAERELNKLANEGYELISTTNPAAADAKASPTTVHFILKRVVKQQP